MSAKPPQHSDWSFASYRSAPPLRLGTHIPPLSGFTATKDIAYHPLFQGFLSRWVWRIYTQRFTPAGRWFLWATLIFILPASISLDLQLYVPFTYAFGLWIVAIIASGFAKPRVTLRAFYSERIRAGEILPVEIEVQQVAKRKGVGLIALPYRLPPSIDSVPLLGIALPLLEPGEIARVRLGLHCKERGVYPLRGFRVETDFPLGLIITPQTFPQNRSLVVTPQFTRLVQLRIPNGRRYQPGGVALASHLGDSFEFFGNREYREGDPIRNIDWRATARLNRPVVREFREEYFLRAAVVLDTQIPSITDLNALRIFERAVSLCAAVVDFMARSEYLVDLFAAGPDVHKLTAGRGLANTDEVLDLLANVEASSREAFAALKPEMLEYLTQLTSAVCILMDWDETRRKFVEMLGKEGAGVKVIIIRDKPCTMLPISGSSAHAQIITLTSSDIERGVTTL